MKNILLKSLYKITNQGQISKPSEVMLESDSFACYQRMQQLSTESFRKYMKGDWTLVELGGSFENLHKAFKYTMFKTRQLLESNSPCNILYVDPDVLCLRPIQPFGDKQNSQCHVYGAGNCGVRYFRHDMSPRLWDRALDMYTQWNYERYDYEQEIYLDLEKAAAQRASVHIEDYIANNPLWNRIHQEPCFHGRHSGLSTIELNEVINSQKLEFEFPVVHFHSSRIPCATLSLMEKVWNHNQQAAA